MKIYCGRNRNGVWKASLDETKLDRFSNVFESEVETFCDGIVYMIRVYCGYDYDYRDQLFGVVKYVRKAFGSVSEAKKDDVWEERAQIARENLNEYHVAPLSIASDDSGEPFVIGDAMMGKFNMKICEVQVI